MILFSPKIDRDRANNVRCKILRNGNFNKEKHILHYLLYLGQLLSHISSFYHFGIPKVSSLGTSNGFNGFFQIGDTVFS